MGSELEHASKGRWAALLEMLQKRFGYAGAPKPLKNNKTYSYSEDTKAVAFLDVIGFANLTTSLKRDDGTDPALLAFALFQNTFLLYRNSMKHCAPQFPRDIPPAGRDVGHRMRFWYREISEGAVNFVCVSDSLLLYSNSIEHLVHEVSAIMGAAIVHGVPIRGAMTIGEVFHSESMERPGASISLFGNALTRAAKIEAAMHGTGVRIRLAPEVLELIKSIPSLQDMVKLDDDESGMAELKWWLKAITADERTRCKSESDELATQFQRWFSDKHTRNWFSGPNCDATKLSLALAVAELKALGR